MDEASVAVFMGGLTSLTLFQPRLTDQLRAFPASSLPGIWAERVAAFHVEIRAYRRWMGGFRGDCERRKGVLTCTKEKRISRRSGKSLFGNIHDEDEEESWIHVCHLFSKRRRSELRRPIFSLRLLGSWWKVLPLHKATWVIVHTPLYFFCICRGADGEW